MVKAIEFYRDYYYKAPSPSQPDAELRARIEAGIREFQGEAKPLSLKEVRDFCLWLLGQPQDTWTDAELGLKEEKPPAPESKEENRC